MKQIDSHAKTVKELLANTKYTIDFYQREYSWTTKEIADLVDDLTDAFDRDYDDSHDRQEVANYGNYFMGSIVICDAGSQLFIVDGQQRLTTLTLILIHLYHKMISTDDKAAISNMIFSTQFGKKSFNLSISERERCMTELFEGAPLSEDTDNQSVRNLINRYQDIENKLSDELTEKAIPFFSDWLTEKVNIVEITAFDDGDAYEIFETMNDRGLSLTPTDMMKGYLLSRVTSIQRDQANRIWIERSSELKNKFNQDADSDAIKAWLRSQYAQTIRANTRRAAPGDFDLIGTEFHRWIRANEDLIRLDSSSHFFNFIDRDFEFYTRWYSVIRNAAHTQVDGLECIFYNNQAYFTLQYFAIMSTLRVNDSNETIMRKLRVVSRYIDILIHRRSWNWRNTTYNAMRNNIFRTVLEIRQKNIDELAKILYNKLCEQPETFSSNNYFSLTGNNRRKVHDILARITDYVGTAIGESSRYGEYMYNPADPYQIEHIWASDPTHHEDEFKHPEDFRRHRNRIGGLLLLPRSFNAAFGAAQYEEKYDPYFGQNILAQSLHESAYTKNPNFNTFRNKNNFPFHPHIQFKKADFEHRQELYQVLAERVWDPNLLYNDAGISVE